MASPGTREIPRAWNTSRRAIKREWPRTSGGPWRRSSTPAKCLLREWATRTCNIVFKSMMSSWAGVVVRPTSTSQRRGTNSSSDRPSCGCRDIRASWRPLLPRDGRGARPFHRSTSWSQSLMTGISNSDGLASIRNSTNQIRTHPSRALCRSGWRKPLSSANYARMIQWSGFKIPSAWETRRSPTLSGATLNEAFDSPRTSFVSLPGEGLYVESGTTLRPICESRSPDKSQATPHE